MVRSSRVPKAPRMASTSNRPRPGARFFATRQFEFGPADSGMVLLKKKVIGIGFVLLGGLVAADGVATGRTWETLLGLLMLLPGVVLLVAKVVRRNIPDAGAPDR